MRETGIIFAALDCDPDVVQEYNRWYDLEHLPPNAAMDGVTSARRYVAPRALRDIRSARLEQFDDGRTSFLTIYGINVAADVALQRMTDLREELVDANRMRFPDDKKVVRLGDALTLDRALPDPALCSTPDDVPHLGHTAIDVIMRRGSESAQRWYAEEFGPRVVDVPGVLAVASYSSTVNFPGRSLDLLFLDGDPVAIHRQRLKAVAHHPEADVELDGPFQLICPLHYPWLDEMA